MPSFIAKVTGRVQGVGFRYFIQRKADSHNLRGYAKNVPDGSVEVVAEGDRAGLIDLAKDLKKGPFLSQVDDVQVVWSDSEQNFKDFSVRH